MESKIKAHDNKRLAKNTLLLYGRTILILFIGLFTSRVILNTLGVDDYGIYNVVCGFVSMFSIVSHTLTSTTQRFLNFELGKEDNSRAQKLFGASMTIHIAMSIILILLLETIGVWFLNTQMNIASERMVAANFAFQCSIFTFIFNILSQPYNAAIIAHERMGTFAYISLLDVVIKLAIVYMLYLSTFDKLIVYAILLMLEATFIRSIYSRYSHKHFAETKFVFVKDKALYKEIVAFASLNFLGVLASVLSNQGVNILLNIFFGVTLNAARGIANQVNHAILKFVGDFMTALRPQITKTCASGDYHTMRELCYKGTRFSFFLILLFAVPIIYKTPYILDLWLKTYPEEAIIFVRLTLILSLAAVLSKTTNTAILAAGKIKKFTYIIGTVNLLTLPICYIALKLGAPAFSVYCINIIIEFVLLSIRLLVLRGLLDFPIRGYISNVLLPILGVSIPVFAICYYLNNCFSNSILDLFFYLILSTLITCSFIITLGMKKSERKKILNVVINKIKNI